MAQFLLETEVNIQAHVCIFVRLLWSAMRLRNVVYVNVIDGTEYEMLWAVDTDKKTLASGSGLLQLAYLNFFFSK